MASWRHDRPPRRLGRIGGRWAPIVVALAILITSFGTTRVAAVETARTGNGSNVFSMTALYAPSGLAAVPLGHDVKLTWNAGANGNGYAVLGVANGTSTDCSAASVASIGTSTSLAYTDTGRYTPQGTRFCYEVQTSYGAWTSVTSNPRVAAQLGFVTVRWCRATAARPGSSTPATGSCSRSTSP
jgi:hypothetical protein